MLRALWIVPASNNYQRAVSVPSPGTVRTWRQEAMQGDTTEQGSVAAHYRECQTLPKPPDGVSAQAHADEIIALITRKLFMQLRG